MLISQKKAIDSVERSRKASRRSDPRKKYWIDGTKFYLAIPSSLGAPGATFTIGPVVFELNHTKKIAKPRSAMPDSWRVELQEMPVGVEDIIEDFADLV
ncbi:hypothetical protein ACKI2N_012490 [Cupriavidus sp. 30B13]|uniref:hypothetical protein n=1 Tax=Cupriavidus sp. 30B13 TaxID=3384241 RepID=UPI003B8ED2D4